MKSVLPLAAVFWVSLVGGGAVDGTTPTAVARTMKPGKIVVRGRYPKKQRREGKARKSFYLVGAGTTFRLAAGGPVRLVLLVRGLRSGRAKFDVTSAGRRGQVEVPLHTKVSRGVFISLAKGTHLLLVKADQDILVRPVKVRRKPVPGEIPLEWRTPAPPATPLAASAARTKPPPAADMPRLAPVPVSPTPSAGSGSGAAEPPTSAPLAPATRQASAKPASTAPPGVPTTTPASEASLARPAGAAAGAGGEAGEDGGVETKIVGEKRIPARPPRDPSGTSAFGQRGIWHTWSARSLKFRSIAVSSAVEFFKAAGFVTAGDSNQRLQGRLVAAGSPLPGLEINAGFSIVSNQNTAFTPTESQSIGDPFLGLRYGYQLADWFALGAGVQSVFPTGRKFSQLSTEGISTRILFAFDFIPLPESLVSLNVGYHFDNSSRIFDYEINAAQRFAAGVYPHDQVLLGLGLAWQFGPVAPFLEYGSAIAVGSSDMGFVDSPSWLTLGVRVWPLRFHDFQVLAAVDIGLTATGGSETDPTRIPPYNVVLALAYDFGSVPPPDVVEKQIVRVEKKTLPCTAPGATPTGVGSRVVGRVLDADTGKPVGSARVVMGGKEPAIFLSEPEQGRFFTCPMTPGPVRLRIYRDGYREESRVVLVSDRPHTPVTIKLVRTGGAAHGTVKGNIRAITGVPLPALVSVPARNVNFRADKNGKFAQRLETGTFDLLISMPGYVTQRRKVKLEAGAVVILNVELHPKK